MLVLLLPAQRTHLDATLVCKDTSTANRIDMRPARSVHIIIC
jgi:hypothetical protein